jgi:Putative prokaryotic signal transducing protein
MEDFVTVATFNFVHELYPVKIQLEHMGIACFIKDEYTIQVSPYLSAALGGIKLQVMKADYNAAMTILKEIGYLDEANKLSGDRSTSNFDKYSARVPLLNRLGVRERLLTVIVLAILLVFLLLAIKN